MSYLLFLQCLELVILNSKKCYTRKLNLLAQVFSQPWALDCNSELPSYFISSSYVEVILSSTSNKSLTIDFLLLLFLFQQGIATGIQYVEACTAGKHQPQCSEQTPTTSTDAADVGRPCRSTSLFNLSCYQLGIQLPPWLQENYL